VGDPVASARRALEFVADGQILGLGTGRAASAFVRELAERCRTEGLSVRGVPTSEATGALARELGIPLLALAEAVEAGGIDVTFDGADEVAPSLDVVKGYGGAHVREKVVAAASKTLVILVGEEKLVDVLGERGRLPVEVLPFAWPLCREQLRKHAGEAVIRTTDDGEPVVSDNGNWIADCRVPPLDDPRALEAALLAIPGVLGTGLFLGMADAVIVERAGGVEVLRRPGAPAAT